MKKDSRNISPGQGIGKYRDILYPVLLFFLSFNFYLFFLSANYNFDGVVFALFLKEAIVTGNPFIHPHYQHPLYQPLVFGIYKLLFLKIDPLIYLQVLDAVAGALSTALFYLLALKIAGDRIASVFLSLAFSFSFAIWYFSTDSEIHIFSVLFIILSLLFLERENLKLSAVFAAMACMFHITNIFFLVALLIYRGKKVILYSLPVLSIYIIFPIIKGKEFLGWFLSHFTRSSRNWFSIPGLGEFTQHLLSFAKCISPVYLFSVPVFLLALLLMYRYRLKLPWYWFSLVFLFFLFWVPGNFEFKTVLVPAVFISFARIKRREAGIILAILLLIFNFSYFMRRADPHTNRAMQLSEKIASITEPDAWIYVEPENKEMILQKAYLIYFFSRKSSYWHGAPLNCSHPSYLLTRRILPVKGISIYDGIFLYKLCELK